MNVSKETMSQFLNKEDLYKAKSERLEKENEKLEQDLIAIQKAACENLFLEKVKNNEIIKKLQEEVFILKKSLNSSLEIQAGQGVEVECSKLEDVLQEENDKLFIDNLIMREALEFINDTAPPMYEYNDVEMRMVLRARKALKELDE